jgi:MFS family permease
MVPLYVAKFLWNLVFWYSIEKLFMVSIGFNNESIAFMVAVYAAMSVLMEVPSGVLADRWSRKGVLALGALCLTIALSVPELSASKNPQNIADTR